jgi:prephenate dehydrogenase
LRVAVVGLGLIGGSIALAARELLKAEVSGWDADPRAIETAVRRGAVASGAGSLASAVAEADAVFVAAPVAALPSLIREVLADAPAGCAVSDAGSTKRSVVEAITDARFVGGHPLAGAETSGVEHARADMFAGATWYLTPSSETAATTLAHVGAMVSAMGARPVEISPLAHDRLMATVSHLPHVFANVLVTQLAGADQLVGADAAAVPGPSFRDATRVAGSNTAVWSGIYMDNRDALGQAIDDAVARLAEVRAALAAGDREALVRWSEQAAADRERLQQ